MDGKNVIDVSSFMLFEAIGDSEADDSQLNMASMEVDMGVADGDDDDAESCSCDMSDCGGYIDLGGVDDNPGNAHDDDDHVVDDDDEREASFQVWGDGDDDDDGVVEKSTPRVGQHKKLRGCVDSTMEMMSEMEQSRLFWEACLAS